MNPFKLNTKTTWCPGCGNFGILESLSQVLEEASLKPQDVLVVSGIGQAAKLPHYIHAHGMNTLHGRAVPAAMGAHVANPALKLILTSGDGDTYGEGGNHLLHGIRRNLDIVHMVHDNQVYGLTKGQGSPTTAFGQVTRLQYDGMKSDPLNPMAFAISVGCGFVARSFSGDPKHLKEIIKAAMAYKGYALIDILQPCVSFNQVNTFKWYKDRVFKLPETYDPHDKVRAFEMAQQFGDEGIPIGILYQEQKTDFLGRFSHLEKPLVQYERSPKAVDTLLDELL
ncbi:2-oxoacid ferredoxin oxidoreductase [Fusibacter paucivorans]|uniref:2-oxoacid ferredoxin oxidoreductase n=1 Tax=Fusibacter paucivorans TaxID=76009 RepID=A0ABS5PLT4_9FIRM|nr:thiamine pyrophosphate-dependent enzyme [Fusibacter paucivorans]MBS7526133.1 2-oxoacid ferredoxin oxidoreductase [Fusibacter paucivorans]